MNFRLEYRFLALHFLVGGLLLDFFTGVGFLSQGPMSQDGESYLRAWVQQVLNDILGPKDQCGRTHFWPLMWGKSGREGRGKKGKKKQRKVVMFLFVWRFLSLPPPSPPPPPSVSLVRKRVLQAFLVRNSSCASSEILFGYHQCLLGVQMLSCAGMSE